MSGENFKKIIKGEGAREDFRSGGILDAVSSYRQNVALRSFSPEVGLNEYIMKLKERDREVLIDRHGLATGQGLTLEKVGKKLNLTRERVRQLEQEAIKKLLDSPAPSSFAEVVELIFKMIADYGNIVNESKLLDILLANHPSLVAKRAVLFILRITNRFKLFDDQKLYHRSWYIDGFDQEFLEQVISLAHKILQSSAQPFERKLLFSRIRAQLLGTDANYLTDEILENLISISRLLDKNPFQEWGLVGAREIRPKDVGDKAYLVLEHLEKPEHYDKITELINKYKFDHKVANKETVHNELIKDERFVLVGRGIYALRAWGYKEGVVADIMAEILRSAGRPLPREEIIEEVLKQRVVKRNTIIVGLSNKQRFKKTSDGQYALGN